MTLQKSLKAFQEFLPLSEGLEMTLSSEGAPNETVYYLDGVEIPNINHFSTQGSAGGPVGMLNVDFIREVTLSASAFGAEYDNPLSGVLAFEQRDGNSQKSSTKVRVGASEAGFTLILFYLKEKKNDPIQH